MISSDSPWLGSSSFSRLNMVRAGDSERSGGVGGSCPTRWVLWFSLQRKQAMAQARNLLHSEARCYNHMSRLGCLAGSGRCNIMSHLTAEAISFVNNVFRGTPDVRPCHTSPPAGSTSDGGRDSCLCRFAFATCRSERRPQRDSRPGSASVGSTLWTAGRERCR